MLCNCLAAVLPRLAPSAAPALVLLPGDPHMHDGAWSISRFNQRMPELIWSMMMSHCGKTQHGSQAATVPAVLASWAHNLWAMWLELFKFAYLSSFYREKQGHSQENMQVLETSMIECVH